MKKITWFISLLLVLGFVLTACGSNTDTADTGSDTTSDSSSDTVTLKLWAHQNPTFNDGYEALIAAYKAENPNVDIVLETFEYDTYIQTLGTSMPAGEEADILQLFGTWTADYAERLAPMPESVMSISEAKDLYYEAPIGGFIVDDVLYGLPQEYNIEYGGVLVNKTMFEEAGLTYPPEWNTRADMLADAAALVQTDDAGLMTVAGYHFTSSDAAVFDFLAGIRQRGGDYWNGDQTGFTFNTDEAKASLEWMQSAVEEGVVDPILFEDASNWVGDAFFEGHAGIGYIGPWAISMGVLDFPDFEQEWDYVVLPPQVDDAEPVFVADSGWGLVVSPNSKHQDIAWDFVKFAAANEENAGNWNITSSTLPAIRDLAESDTIAEAMPFIVGELDQLPYGTYLGAMPDRDLIIYDIVFPHLLSVFQGIETVDEALQSMDSEANATFE